MDGGEGVKGAEMGLGEENGVVGEEEEVVDDALWEGSAQGNGAKKVKGWPSVAFAELFRNANAFNKFLIVASTVGAVATNPGTLPLASAHPTGSFFRVHDTHE